MDRSRSGGAGSLTAALTGVAALVAALAVYIDGRAPGQEANDAGAVQVQIGAESARPSTDPDTPVVVTRATASPTNAADVSRNIAIRPDVGQR